MMELYFIINVFWQWVLSGCNNIKAACKEGIWKGIMAVIISALKYKRVDPFQVHSCLYKTKSQSVKYRKGHRNS